MRRHIGIHGGLFLAVGLGIGSCSSSSPTTPVPVCTVSLAPASAALGADGGPGSVTIATAAGCAWSITGGAGWLTVTSASTGTGPATVTYTAAVNAAPAGRSAGLVIGGQTHTVSQAGRPAQACAYELSKAGDEYGHDAGTGTIGVTAPDGCEWTATSTESWLLITGGSPGSGSGSVTFAFSRNPEIAERQATIRVADRSFTMRQAGDVGECDYSVSPVDLSACMPAGTLTAMVTTQASCPWTVASSAPWMTLQSGGSGSGSGIITFAFSENYDAPREGILQVRWPTPTAGQNIRFAQAGCLYAVTQSSFNVPAAGTTSRFDVLQQSDPNTCGGATQDRCVWSAVSDVPWITITSSMPRSGDNPVLFTVASNPGTSARVGRITVRDKVVLVTQAGQ